MKHRDESPKRRRSRLNRERRRARRRLISRFKRKFHIRAPLPLAFLPDVGARSETTVHVPRHLSMLSHTDEMLRMQQELERAIASYHTINLDMMDVEELQPDGLAVFLAWISSPATKRQRSFVGNVPQTHGLRMQLAASGFFEHVSTPARIAKSQQSRFFLRQNRRVEPVMADEAVKIARAGGHLASFGVIIEAMANTVEHASGTGSPERWVLHVANDAMRKVSRFVFVDAGRGLFRGLRRKFGDALRRVFGLATNVDLVRPLLDGQIGSRTGIRHRGKGIPEIYRTQREGEIQNLTIIANDVYMDIANSRYYLIKPEFKGTFLTWEIPSEPSA